MPLRFQGWMATASNLMKRAEDAMLALLLAAMMLIGGWQIFMRNVLGVSLSWADESQRLLLLWLALLGAMAASRDRRQLRIDLASRYLSGLPKRAVEAFADLLTAVVSGIIGWSALNFVRETYSFGDVLVGTVPAWIVQAILPVAFLMMALRHLLDGLLSVIGRAREPETGS
jgi:TRAP-type C4-dicarboxylate transport system permease small subunit